VQVMAKARLTAEISALCAQLVVAATPMPAEAIELTHTIHQRDAVLDAIDKEKSPELSELYSATSSNAGGACIQAGGSM